MSAHGVNQRKVGGITQKNLTPKRYDKLEVKESIFTSELPLRITLAITGLDLAMNDRKVCGGPLTSFFFFF